MPESTSIPTPSDDLDLTSVPEAKLVNKQDPVAGTNNNQPPMDPTMVAVPSSQDIRDIVNRFTEHWDKEFHDRDVKIDQLEKALKKALQNNVSVGTMANDPRNDKKRIEELEALRQEDTRKIRELEATFQETKDYNQVILKNWRNAEDSLQKANQNPSSDFTSSRDIDDNSVRKKLDTLSTRIEGVAKSYFSGSPMTANARAEIKVLFDRITPDWAKRYLKDERRKQYFIEAVIWHKLIDTFLKHPLTILSEDMGAALYDLHNDLWRRFNTSIYVNIANVPTGSKPLDAEKLQDYHSARLKMAELHIRVKGKNGLYLGDGKTAVKSKAELAADLGAMLSNYTSKTKTCEYQTELQIIVQLAVDLAESMAMAKAHYAVRMGTSLYGGKVHGFAFRPGSMESIAAPVRDNEVVELVVSPVLVKCGTSEGVDYDRLNVLEKARVFCK
ncbi:hypothetical protein PG987_015494 [Apiospora arundinis]